MVEQVHKEAATFPAVVDAGQHITNAGSQDTAGLKITDEGHATTVVASATNHFDGHISQSLPVDSEGETSSSLLHGVGSVQQSSISDCSQGLPTDGGNQVTDPHINSEGPVQVHSSSVKDGHQGLKTEGEDQVAGLNTNSEGHDHVSSSSVNDGSQGLKTAG